MTFLLAAAAACAFLQGPTMEPRLMKQPSIHGDTVVFSYAGDLWVTHLHGGTARHLTTSPGIENNPEISPDGKTVAFTGQYDGLRDIYTIPIEGGEPKRLTYDPLDICLGWTPEGKIAYGATEGFANGRQLGLWFVDPAGGLPEATKLSEVNSLSFFPDGKTIAYERQNSFNFNWRHYRGGSQGKISFYNFPENKYWELPSKREQSYFPLVVGHSVFYISDRGSGVLNLYRYDMDSKQDRQLTHYDDADIRTPSTDGKTIVYERDGLLYAYDIASGNANKIDAKILSEDLSARPYLRNLSKDIGDFDISPSGARVLVEARGNLFTVPAKQGDVRNLTNFSGARAQNAGWSPDGKSIAYMSDQTGNYEIYTQPQMGGPQTQLTFNTPDEIEFVQWSATGKYISFGRSDNTLWMIEVATKKLTKLAAGGENEIEYGDWSPDDRWYAYTVRLAKRIVTLFACEVATGKSTPLDNGIYSIYSHAFDLSGKYLYVVSDRTFSPSFGQFEYSLKVENSGRLYVIPLTKDTPSPLAIKSQEETDSPPAAGAKSPAITPEVKIDFDGISNRILPLPMPAGSYVGIVGGNNCVYYNSAGTLSKFDLESRETSVIVSGVIGFAINPNRTKIAYKAGGVLSVSDLHPGIVPSAGKIDTSSVEAIVNPRDEWRQIYWEAWRLERDEFYDSTMHGLDWNAVGKHYAEYLKWVNSRADLNYVIGLLIGELGNSHTYISGGDMGAVPPPVPIGRLGVDYEVVGNNVRIAKIYPGHNDDEATRGVLSQPGVNVSQGDYLLAIDDRTVDAHTNPSALLVDKADKYVTLTVNSSPTMTGSRKVRVRPISDELAVRYLDYIDRCAKLVSDLSQGRIGYMHIRNTSAQGAQDFIRGFYSQTDKQAMIVDERWNGGGYVQPWFVDTLSRKMYAYVKGRDIPSPLPVEYAIVGPKAMLINGYAGSGGDFFPYMFRFAGLGPLIGERTWGGLVGIGSGPNLLDGGSVTIPASPIFNPETGEIIAENHGVDPDVTVDARPDLIADGKDPQLEAAVKYLLDQLAKHPQKPLPQTTPKISPLGKAGA